MKRPSGDMLAAAGCILHFIANRDETQLTSLFARDVTIVENFAPFIFKGPDAVASWQRAMLQHLKTLSELAFEIGKAQDFTVKGQWAFFVLPVCWTGRLGAKPFEEHGGQSFVLCKQRLGWRVAGYAWAPLSMRFV